MEIKRKPFQGLLNILRFNWHFYLIAGLVVISLLLFENSLPKQVQPLAVWFALLAILSIAFSLIISWYVYDFSGLYQIEWVSEYDKKHILNVNAGFDETSEIIKFKLPNSELAICDFYNPTKHTEVSIKRARKAYPPHKTTLQVSTGKLPFQDNSFDCTLAFLSAHEIRDEKERELFFKELNRVTKSTGEVYITEHLRDLHNFLAYTIGFFHFHSKAAWLQTFKQANFSVKREIKTTPFITTFQLSKNGNTL